MRWDQYRLRAADSGEVHVRCRRCDDSANAGDRMDVAVLWAEEHELVCVGDDKPGR